MLNHTNLDYELELTDSSSVTVVDCPSSFAMVPDIIFTDLADLKLKSVGCIISKYDMWLL